eukprot:scaffold7356_cov88-Isochrysis_galbana.AAC.2
MLDAGFLRIAGLKEHAARSLFAHSQNPITPAHDESSALDLFVLRRCVGARSSACCLAHASHCDCDGFARRCACTSLDASALNSKSKL